MNGAGCKVRGAGDKSPEYIPFAISNSPNNSRFIIKHPHLAPCTPHPAPYTQIHAVLTNIILIKKRDGYL
jgi:hypothetical protein